MSLVLILLVVIFGIAGIMYLLIQNQPKDINSVKDLSEIFPIQTIEDGYLVNGNGDITIGYKVNMPDVFLLSEEEARNIHESFVSIFKLLPEGTIFHKQDFFYLDEYQNKEHIENLVHRENINHYNGRKLLLSYSYIYLTFINKVVKDKSTTTSLQSSPNYIFGQPFKTLPDRILRIKHLAENFHTRIKSITGFTVLEMSNEDLANASFDFVNMSYDKPCTDGFDRVVNPMSVDSDGQLKIGDKFVSVLSLIEEGTHLFPFKEPKTAPGSTYNNGVGYSNNIKSKTSMVFPICCGLPINHIVNTTIEILDKDKTISELKSEKKSLNAINFLRPVSIKQSLIDEFVNIMLHHDHQLCRMAVNVIIDDVSKVELNQKVGHVEAAFINMNESRVLRENFDTANLFFASMGGNANCNYRSFINTVQQSIPYINKESILMSDAKGFVVNDRFGNPLVIDMWDAKGLDNRNELWLGPSGSGKSFNVNGKINQLFMQGNHIMMIDIGHSYERLCHLNGGTYFDSSKKESLSFNIFLCRQDADGNYLYKDGLEEGAVLEDKDAADDKVTFLTTILMEIWKGNEKITRMEQALLQKSITKFYEYVNKNKIFPCFNSYVDFLDEFDKDLNVSERKHFIISDLKILFEKFYKGGVYEHFLNSSSNIDIVEEKFIVFDLEAVSANKDLFTLMCIIIIELALDKTKRLKGVKKTLIIDEAINFLIDPKMGDFIGYLYRTFRKKEGQVCIATQNVEFLESADPLVQQSITFNTATYILLDHSKHKKNYISIQRMLSFTDHDIQLLDSITQGPGYREFFMKMGDRSMILRMEVSDFAVAVFDSRQKEVQKINELTEKYGSLPTALYQYLENKKNQN